MVLWVLACMGARRSLGGPANHPSKNGALFEARLLSKSPVCGRESGVDVCGVVPKWLWLGCADVRMVKLVISPMEFEKFCAEFRTIVPIFRCGLFDFCFCK